MQTNEDEIPEMKAQTVHINGKAFSTPIEKDGRPYFGHRFCREMIEAWKAEFGDEGRLV